LPTHPAAAWPWKQVPHFLLVGATGAGKTTQLRVMAASLLAATRPATRALCLADGEGSDWGLMFAGQAGVLTANGPAELADLIGETWNEMHKRRQQYTQARQRMAATHNPAGIDWKPPRWLHLWIDEYLAGVMQLPAKQRAEAIDRLTQIVIGGRKVRMRVGIGVQRPDARVMDAGLPGLLKAELKLRMATVGIMGLDDMEGRMAFDDAHAGRYLKMEQGEALVRVGRREVRYNVPWLADGTDLEATAADRRAAWAAIPRPVEERIA